MNMSVSQRVDRRTSDLGNRSAGRASTQRRAAGEPYGGLGGAEVERSPENASVARAGRLAAAQTGWLAQYGWLQYSAGRLLPCCTMI